MNLVAEQIKYLRERRQELVQKRSVYSEYLETRDRTGYDNIGPQYGDIQNDMEYGSYLNVLKTIDETLERSTFKESRNFEIIDVGTIFTVTFDGEDTESILLVEKGITYGGTRMVSLDSDLGKAVQGHKDGDEISYKVQATGKTINIRIEGIERLRENYEHFIRERKSKSRISDTVKRELKEIRERSKEEYEKRFMVTPSQVELAKEELKKIGNHPKDPVDISRRVYLNKMIKPTNIIMAPPEDDSIGVGSHVEIILKDEFGNIKEMSFELINSAISTELESHYVERISPLGSSIFGLREGETFKVNRKNLPKLKGIVKSVDNNYGRREERVK